MLTARPKATDLVFQLFGRPLHPELFTSHQRQTIRGVGYEAQVSITSTGHVVTWKYAGLTLTEVAAAAATPLPTRRRLMGYKLGGERSDRVACAGGVGYHMSFQCEHVEPTVFWSFQQELALEGRGRGLFHAFNDLGRIALGALSCVRVEPQSRRLLVEAVHTFPAEYAIVKTQSLFDIPALAKVKA